MDRREDKKASNSFSEIRSGLGECFDVAEVQEPADHDKRLVADA
jgi:hypothetical protein